MADITDTLSEPFSERSDAVTVPIPAGAVALDGRLYQIDTANDLWQRVGIDVVQQRNSNDARDTLLLPQDVWRQQTHGWHQGAGQSNVDRDNSLPYRYEDSFGIDPWTKWQISLLPATAALGSTPTADYPMFLNTHGTSLVVGNNDKLYWYTDESTVVPLTVASSDPIVDQTYDGDSIITLHASGKVYKSTNNTTTALFGASAGYASASFISYVKDRLLIGVANILKDITSGTATTVYTSPVTGFRWVGACEGLTNIYLIGGAGDRSVVHSTQLNTAGTALDPPIVAAMLPDGEVGYSIGGYLGFVFIGTDKGVRMGTLSTNLRVTTGTLTLGAIIPTTEPVRCFEGQDRFVWFGQDSIASAYTPSPESDSFPATTCCGLGRMDLTTFTITEATPAYANDLVALTQTGKDVTAVCTWNDKRVFAVRNGGVYIQQATYMEAGWLTQGAMSYTVEDLKTGLYMQAKWLPLAGEISLDMAYDGTGYVRIGDLTIQDSIRSDNITLGGVQFSRFNARYVLRADTGNTDTPHLTRWELRSIPVRGPASRWTIPILNHEKVTINNAEIPRDPTAEFDTLLALVEGGTVFPLQESGKSYLVHGRQYQWQPQKLSSNGQAWQGIFTIQCDEVR